MIRSVVDRPPPSYCAKAAQWWSSISGEAYITRQLWHVWLRVDDVVAFCYSAFFLFFPFLHQLMCCGDDQLPLWRHTSHLNCDDRCDNGWLLVQSYQAIWCCLDVLILGCSDVSMIKLLHENINHTSVVTEANNFFPLFSVMIWKFSLSLNSQEVLSPVA